MNEFICVQKDPLSDEDFIKNANKINEIIKSQKNFLFYFSPDPDAVGTSVALALYIRLLNKQCTIFLPDGFDKNLDFLFDIAVYNNINVAQDLDKIKDIIENQNGVIISCDTPTHFLLPNYNEILDLVDNKSQQTHIEIDHHFGGDSEQTFKNAVTLFSKTNSCCEIIAEFFTIIGFDVKDISPEYIEKIKQKEITDIDLDRYFPRNIVLSLLVGICFDTQFGKFVTNKGTYDKWFTILSKRLQDLTWGDARKISTASMVFDTINHMNDAKKRSLEKFEKKIITGKGIGLLIMPKVDKYESLSKSKDSTCVFCKLVGDFSNLVPDVAGAIGIFTFYDTAYQLYYVKIRRSAQFKEYDLRQIEALFNEIFKAYFLGGGGHEGASSFRVADIGRSKYVKKIKQLYKKLIEQVGDITAPYAK